MPGQPAASSTAGSPGEQAAAPPKETKPVEAPKPETSAAEPAKPPDTSGEAAKPQDTEPAPAPEVKPEEPAARPARETRASQTGRGGPPPAPAEAALQIVTSPPGAKALLDDDPAKTCTTPCSFQVATGRHTVAVSMSGHRQAFRIIEMSGQSKELFVGLQAQEGSVRVESEPSGAQIYVNNQLRSERTPTTLILPVGTYSLVLVKDGRKVEQAIQVRDGALLRFTLQFP
jgi:hypothetical protein